MAVKHAGSIAGYGSGLLVILLLAIAIEADPAMQTLRRGQRPDILLRAFGQMREVAAAMFILKMDEYFHRGTRHPDGEAHTISDHSHAHHHGEECAGELPSATASLPRKDFISRLNQSIHDQPVRHLGPGEQQELLPWVAAAAAMDPHMVAAYLNGGFWLSEEMRQPAQALRFLEEGRRRNPAAWRIYEQMGQIYFRHLADYARARAFLERALALQPPETLPIEQAQVLTFLAAACEHAGYPAEALRYYEQLRLVTPDDPAPVQKIEMLRNLLIEAGVSPR
ncbi:MAG: tetratricopeptide repeat protein [Candidatus Omnitrophica bacterium]|nr:tetratricopeptide repeat protein [Candidatus Omnitrophota bacterium]